MSIARIPEVKAITFTTNSVRLSNLNVSTFSHSEWSIRIFNNRTEEETRISYYNTNPKSAIRLITRWKFDIFENRTKLLSEIKTLHIFNEDGSEDMIRL